MENPIRRAITSSVVTLFLGYSIVTYGSAAVDMPGKMIDSVVEGYDRMELAVSTAYDVLHKDAQDVRHDVCETIDERVRE